MPTLSATNRPASKLESVIIYILAVVLIIGASLAIYNTQKEDKPKASDAKVQVED